MNIKEKIRAVREEEARATEIAARQAEEEKQRKEEEIKLIKEQFKAQILASLPPLLEIADSSGIENILREANEEMGFLSLRSVVTFQCQYKDGTGKFSLEQDWELEEGRLQGESDVNFEMLSSYKPGDPKIRYFAEWGHWTDHDSEYDYWGTYGIIVSIGRAGRASYIAIEGEKEIRLLENQWGNQEILENAVLGALLKPRTFGKGSSSIPETSW